ncbi:MAG: cytidine deaminase, partial [Alphaproteobacteria bacterium]|nr:cytidine deaminase [Alphaproteobacteria bacterium]
ISYPNGTCAETGAIAAMVSNSERHIEKILIYADSQTLITPCGACLQRIAEFADNSTQILLADKSGIKKNVSLTDLFPCSFNEF